MMRQNRGNEVTASQPNHIACGLHYLPVYSIFADK